MPGACEHVNILLVDDRRENLLALRAILERPDYRLTTAASGEEALGRLLRDEFALLLIDVAMPGMDGLELAGLIKARARTRDVPIIFITSNVDDLRLLQDAYSVGAVDYLLRPTSPDVIRAKVAVFVEVYRRNKRALSELRSMGEARYRHLAEAIPQIVWTARPDGALEYFNARWFEYTALTLAQSQGTGWLDAVHPDDARRVLAQWEAATRSGQPCQIELRLRRAVDGGYRWHLRRGLPERDQDGRIVAWLGTDTDVDDNAQLLDETRRAVRTRDDALAVVSHDLKNPLSSIHLAATLLHRDGAEQKHAEHILRAVDRMNHLITDLLDLARIDAGGLTVARQPHAAAALVDEAFALYEPLARQKGLRLERRNAATEHFVSCDRTRALQVLSNLLGNAIKFSRAGEALVVGALPRQDEVLFWVEDSGPGIPEEQRHAIFDRYWKGRADRPGTGLGLHIAKGIVDAHGGRIWVRSKVGEGTTFYFTLPAAPSATRPTEPTQPTADAAA